MGCCRRVFKLEKGPRSVLCRKLIMPMRLLAIALIWGNVGFALWYRDALTPRIGLVVLIVLALAVSLLVECRRSENYHRVYHETP